MNDFSYIAIIIAFFASAALFVRACDRIIGPDEESEAPRTSAPSDDDMPLAA
jgi:hypothetical protein